MIIHSIVKEEKNKQKMYDIRMEYQKSLSEASVEKKELETELNDCIKKLAVRKKAIITHSIFPFVDLLEQLKKVNFKESDGIRELNDFDPSNIKTVATRYVSKIDTMTISTKSFTSSDFLCLALGVISMGGVFTGVTIGAIIAACSSSVKESERRLKNAELERDRADIVIQNIKIEELAIKNLLAYVQRYTEILTKLNQLFSRSQKIAKETLERCGSQKMNYSIDDRKCLATWINLAKGLKDLLDEPILNQDGSINISLDVTLSKSEQLIGG